MSKVQSPKSTTESSEAAEARKSCNAAAQGEQADIGHWTLDIGPNADIGPWTLGFGLRVSDLRKSFQTPSGDRLEVLRSVSLSVEAGEAVAIMGASGAGKSTLLHLLGGLEAPDHGSIEAGGFSIHDAPSQPLAHFRNHRLGLIFQFHYLLHDLTAAENVSLPLMISRMGRHAAQSRAMRILQKAGLGGRSSHLVGDLSGGERQRVAVCRALVTQPALVLADEPTGNLDAAIGDEIARSLISYARDTPAVVIIATHNSSLAELCDRTLVLKGGKLVSG
ncbi:MAG: ABC transporter ATP-binding protein [Acidobacteriota bacterium]|nr:ABC transporter ATP-binding protein [Acidobacteriota bacterium]